MTISVMCDFCWVLHWATSILLLHIHSRIPKLFIVRPQVSVGMNVLTSFVMDNNKFANRSQYVLLWKNKRQEVHIEILQVCSSIFRCFLPIAKLVFWYCLTCNNKFVNGTTQVSASDWVPIYFLLKIYPTFPVFLSF